MKELPWIRFTDDDTGERFLRYIDEDDEIRAEIRPVETGVLWWLDMETTGHWGRAEDNEEAMGTIDLLREALCTG
jgi:hypothetical protein